MPSAVYPPQPGAPLPYGASPVNPATSKSSHCHVTKLSASEIFLFAPSACMSVTLVSNLLHNCCSTTISQGRIHYLFILLWSTCYVIKYMTDSIQLVLSTEFEMTEMLYVAGGLWSAMLALLLFRRHRL